MKLDLKQCPHCQRKFHEKSVDRHIIRCKEQSIRNNKERPSYQTMEAKRRLAVRLYVSQFWIMQFILKIFTKAK